MSAHVLERALRESVAEHLDRVGLLYRMFARVKASESLRRKIDSKGYSPDGRRLQDLSGIRVVLYFPDDVELCANAMKTQFELVGETIDNPDTATFGPTRYNIVFRLPADLVPAARAVSSDPRVDTTFEVQLRTILSEGWHEVEHDLRYKRKDDWQDNPDLYRAYNGVIATLETCDWTSLQLFDELSLRHYRQQNWEAMTRAKFRLRFASASLHRPLAALLSAEGRAKPLFRTDRRALLQSLLSSDVRLPISVDNILYAANRWGMRDPEIKSMEPMAVKDAFERWPFPAHR